MYCHSIHKDTPTNTRRKETSMKRAMQTQSSSSAPQRLRSLVIACAFCLALPLLLPSTANASPTSAAPQDDHASAPLHSKRSNRRFFRKIKRVKNSVMRCIYKAFRASNFLEAEVSILFRLPKNKKKLVTKVTSIFPEKIDKKLQECATKRASRYTFRRRNHKMEIRYPITLKDPKRR